MFAKVIFNLVIVCALFGSLNANVDQHEDCPQICPLLYAPICGTDGVNFREFSNACEMNANNCNTERDSFFATGLDMCRTELVGSLEKLLTKLGNLDLATAKCLKPCTLIFRPVCISNGKYRFLASNKCIMNTINCVLGEEDNFDVLQYGSC